ncbi:MAG: polysaccharide biosynthesis C-terminal domain-containing protein, partial [Clostridia bacterium]
KQRIPMYTLMAGVAVKIFLNFTLIAIPDINIYGAPMASIMCYSISMLPNLYYVRKYTGMKLRFFHIFGKPALASALMGLVLYFASKWLPSGRFFTVLLIFIGIVSYGAFAILTGAITKSDLAPFMRRFQKRSANSTR